MRSAPSRVVPRTIRVVARATSPVRSGTLMQPWRPATGGSGSRSTGRTATVGAAGDLEDVGLGGMEAALHAEVAGQLGQLGLERGRVAAGRQRDLEDHGVDRPIGVADDASGEVDDVDRLG